MLRLLCALCLVFNAVQFRRVGCVRVVGMLICAAWFVQQTFWQSTGADFGDGWPLLALEGICDLLIAGYAVFRLRVGRIDQFIIALLPATFACGVMMQLKFGNIQAIWWLNWFMVATQMIIGLPWVARQRSLGSYSHGPLRRQQEKQVGGV
jgi:hypothetical protein